MSCPTLCALPAHPVPLRRNRLLAGVFVCLAAFGALSAAETGRVAANFEFRSEADAKAWRQWSPRDEIAPQFAHDPRAGREGRGALVISAGRLIEYGAWRREISGVEAGHVYRFTAWYQATGVENERRSINARLQWLDGQGKPVKVNVRPPEYPLDVARAAGWTKLESVLRAPEGAQGLEVQLSLAFAPGARVRWDSVALAEVPAAPDRVVRLMTVHHRPRNSKSPAANVEAYSELVRGAATQKPDLVCLPEGVTVAGTGKSYIDVAEAVPGPTTERLGALARELRTYIVAGLYERVGPAVYNTAVLIDRDGKLAGRYRKTHLPREEWEGGLTPGDSYPVFDTDFGRLGILVCWDLQFPEPWRAMGLQGAEVVALPIWGGNEKLLPARAIENHAYIVSSSFDMRSCITNPVGEIVAEATNTTRVVTAEVHLDQKFYQPWLGDMSTRTWKERRGDLPPVPAAGTRASVR